MRLRTPRFARPRACVAETSVRALEEPSGPPLLRDLWRLRRIAGIAYAYLIQGSRLRRAYRRAQERGETLWLDEQSSHHRDEAPSDR